MKPMAPLRFETWLRAAQSPIGPALYYVSAKRFSVNTTRGQTPVITAGDNCEGRAGNSRSRCTDERRDTSECCAQPLRSRYIA